MREMTKYHSRHISDVFGERHQKLLAKVSDVADSEDPDENRSKDPLGRFYEYFLTQFASAEVKSGGQFDTSRCVVHVLAEMFTPYKGRDYDPCCGSAGLFVQSEKFVESHGGRRCLLQPHIARLEP